MKTYEVSVTTTASPTPVLYTIELDTDTDSADEAILSAIRENQIDSSTIIHISATPVV